MCSPHSNARRPAVSLRHVVLKNFRDTMPQHMNLQIFLNVMFAGVIAFGVVYNSARVSLSERERDLASLRVLGFTRMEISLILLGEIACATIAALPVGGLIAFALGDLIMAGFNNEVYRSRAAPPRTDARPRTRRRPGCLGARTRHTRGRAE